MDKSTDDRRDKLWSLIKDLKFAMFTTRHPNGHLHSRPMTTQNRDLADDALFFFMGRASSPVADLDGETQVSVAYADPDKDCYVSVSGTAHVVDDPALRKALWHKLNEAWFPQGPNDPQVALVRVDVEHAEYWDVKTNKLVQLYEMAKAAVTGKPPKDMGEHGKVRMH